MNLLRRIIRASKERRTIWQQEAIQRPAAGTIDNLANLHVNLIHIRALFPVYLYIDKVLVHVRCHSFVFKALALHNVAPVAGAVTYTHQNGFVLPFSLFKSLFFPGVPFYRVIGMLQKIRARLVLQSVHEDIIVVV